MPSVVGPLTIVRVPYCCVLQEGHEELLDQRLIAAVRKVVRLRHDIARSSLPDGSRHDLPLPMSARARHDHIDGDK